MLQVSSVKAKGAGWVASKMWSFHFRGRKRLLCLTKSSEELVAARKPPELHAYWHLNGSQWEVLLFVTWLQLHQHLVKLWSEEQGNAMRVKQTRQEEKFCFTVSVLGMISQQASKKRKKTHIGPTSQKAFQIGWVFLNFNVCFDTLEKSRVSQITQRCHIGRLTIPTMLLMAFVRGLQERGEQNFSIEFNLSLRHGWWPLSMCVGDVKWTAHGTMIQRNQHQSNVSRVAGQVQNEWRVFDVKTGWRWVELNTFLNVVWLYLMNELLSSLRRRDQLAESLQRRRSQTWRRPEGSG